MTQPKRIALFGGTGRCGSSMLMRVLDKHPELYVIPDETHPHPYRLKEWKRMRLAPAVDKANLKGARWIAEKSPDNAIFGRAALRLLKQYNGVYVHIIRNRDATVRSIEKFKRYPHKHYGKFNDTGEIYAFVDWVNHIGSNRADFIVDYDLLLVEPRRQLLDLCAFLGISEPTQDMILYGYRAEKSAYYRGTNGRPSDRKLLT